MRHLFPFVSMAVCAFVLSCSPGLQQVAVKGVEDAVKTNNGMVAALTALQENARFRRKAQMIQIARTVGSLEEGRQKLDEVEEAYEPIFDAFRKAELTQSALAKVLELAKAAVNAGEAPPMTDMFALAVKVQEAYNSLAATLAEVH